MLYVLLPPYDQGRGVKPMKPTLHSVIAIEGRLSKQFEQAGSGITKSEQSEKCNLVVGCSPALLTTKAGRVVELDIPKDAVILLAHKANKDGEFLDLGSTEKQEAVRTLYESGELASNAEQFYYSMIPEKLELLPEIP